jgi:hypothetical protein
LNKTYSRVSFGKHLSDTFSITNGAKQADALSPLLFIFALENVITGVQVNQDDLKLNESHQPLVYADYVYILSGSVHTIKEIKEALVVTCKQTGLEVNADKTEYIVTAQDQNAGRSHNVKTDNIFFERVK